MNRKTLKLKLKKEWYDMILSGEKTEEYREIKDWCISKFFNWKNWLNTLGFSGKEVRTFFVNGFLAYPESDLIRHLKEFDSVTFQNGYGKNDPQFEIELLGFEIRTGREDWGAENGVKYFCLKLGKIITK